jgi:transcriptional accessory protein Tex/SPT6
VVEVDVARKRIGLTMRREAPPVAGRKEDAPGGHPGKAPVRQAPMRAQDRAQGSLGQALLDASKRE